MLLAVMTLGAILGWSPLGAQPEHAGPGPELLAALSHASADLPDADAWGEFGESLARASLVGLGEATHGQHEAFEFKRRITMWLVRERRCRLVLFEASSSGARATDEYVQGRSDDVGGAMRGLGMLIWNIEENERFLRELRAWNLAADAHDRVRFAGIDVQDGAAAATRLAELLGEHGADLGARASAMAKSVEPAVRHLWSTGDPAKYNAAAEEARAVVDAVKALREREPAIPEEALDRAEELRGSIEMFRTQGGRDRLMAQRAAAELARAGEGARAVLWAHNAHVTRGVLAHLSSDETAMGGCLAETLGDRYLAVGVTFGAGAFQALHAPEPGAWRFRSYSLPAPPPGSLEDTLLRVRPTDFTIDLRALPEGGPAAGWAAQAHRYRWFGGYGISDSVEAPAADASACMPITPSREFDALIFFHTTAPAKARTP
jgi:erythromycin esterase